MASPVGIESSSAQPPAASEDFAAFTRRLANAEDAAWAEAHARYAPRLYRYLLVVTHGDEQAASDALQGTFVRAVRHVHPFPHEEAWWGWLTLLARHTLADSRRATSRWRTLIQRFFTSVPPDEAPVPADPWDELLEGALATLPSAERSLLEQKYYAGTSVRDLAAAEGTSEKAIESRLTRARARLRDELLRHLHS